jgi:hypothetical protein
LILSKNSQTSLALVRTSSDRWVGWMRTSNGAWRGLDDGDLIVVAVLAAEGQAEVFGFDRATIQAAFDANLAARRARNPKLSLNAPIFVCLDHVAGDAARSVGSNLKAKALWRAVVPLAGRVMTQGEQPETRPRVKEPQAHSATGNPCGQKSSEELKNDLADRVRADVAAAMGVAVEKITIEIRVTL